MDKQPINPFLIKHAEKGDLNQYWYSAHTIEQLVQELLSAGKRCAFLSTPSVYFSLPKASELRANSWVFDFDEQWAKEPHFCKYDYRKPQDIPTDLHHTFDLVCIDPPFITEEVWELYAAAARMLLVPDTGKVVASTVAENAPLMARLLGVAPVTFKPSIPHLVYQYNFYTSFPPSHALGTRNHEIPEDD